MATPFEIADVVELWAWGGQQSITLSALASYIETSIPVESIQGVDADVYDDEESFEFLAQQVFDEILTRQEILGDAYPFASDGYRVRYIGLNGAESSYLFCLLLTHLPATEIQNDQRAFQFETLAMEAARNFFGGRALRIGFPWETATYADLLDQVITLIPYLGQNALAQQVAAGDRGWDILIVKGFRDQSYPQFVALGNCATGRRDWKRKGAEVDPEYFWECFQSERPGTWITFFAVPFQMDENTKRRKAGRSTLTLDRYRICEFAPHLAQDVAAWVQNQNFNALQIPLDSSV